MSEEKKKSLKAKEEIIIKTHIIIFNACTFPSGFLSVFVTKMGDAVPVHCLKRFRDTWHV